MSSFQPGQRIALVHTDDPYTDLRPGDTGTVTSHNQAEDTLDVDWDTGSELTMLLGAGDRVRLVETVPDSPSPGWDLALQQLRLRGTEAGRGVADAWARRSFDGLPAEGAKTVARHLLTGIDGRDPAVLALLPVFTPTRRWGERDYAEINYYEAVADSAHLLPEDAEFAPGWDQLSDGQRADTVAASRESFNAAVRERIREICSEHDLAAEPKRRE